MRVLMPLLLLVGGIVSVCSGGTETSSGQPEAAAPAASSPVNPDRPRAPLVPDSRSEPKRRLTPPPSAKHRAPVSSASSTSANAKPALQVCPDSILNCDSDDEGCPTLANDTDEGPPLAKLYQESVNESRTAGRNKEALCIAKYTDRCLSLSAEGEGRMNYDRARAWWELGCPGNACSAIAYSLSVRPGGTKGYRITCGQCRQWSCPDCSGCDG